MLQLQTTTSFFEHFLLLCLLLASSWRPTAATGRRNVTLLMFADKSIPSMELERQQVREVYEAVADIALNHTQWRWLNRSGGRGGQREDAQVAIRPEVHIVDCSPIEAPMIAMDLFYKCKCPGTSTASASTGPQSNSMSSPNSDCSSSSSPLGAIVGPVCPYAFAQVGRFSQRWGVPIISDGIGLEFDNTRSDFPTLTRINGLSVRQPTPRTSRHHTAPGTRTRLRAAFEHVS